MRVTACRVESYLYSILDSCLRHAKGASPKKRGKQVFEEKTVSDDVAMLNFTALRKGIVAGLQESIDNNVIERSAAKEIVKAIFSQFGITPTGDEAFSTYSVVVSLWDEEVFVVNGVEADSDYNAEVKVADGISIDRIRVSVELSYEDECGTYSGESYLEQEVTDALEYSASEED